MRWSVRLGSLFGIPVYLHYGFLLLLGFIAISRAADGGLGAAVGGVVFVAAIFGCVVLHEFGHALTARRFGIRTRDVTLLPIGGVARLERMPEDPKQELWVALAGPAVNVAIAGLLGIWLFLTGVAPISGRVAASFAANLLAVNLGLVLFNMLPAFPMDGGRVLRALLAQRTDYARATDVAATIGKAMAGVFAVAGLFWNPMLLLVALFVWAGAGQEAAYVRHRAGYSTPRAGFQAARPRIPWYRDDREPPRGRRSVYRIGPWLVYRD